MSKSNLRTLKDMEFYLSRPPYRKVVLVSKLKTEAVKWVKFNEEAMKKNEKLPDRMGQHYGTLNEGAIIFIKHFFNITEEDLK